MDELTFGGKKYISSKKAAKITGYAKDYVGQLCREGRVKARLVGRSWYVLEESIREHRFGGDEVPKHNVPKKQGANKKSIVGNIRYTSEEVVSLHEISDDSEALYLEPKEDGRVLHGVSMMQEVWHDWFATSKPVEEPNPVSKGVVDLRDEINKQTPDNTIEINIKSSDSFLNSKDLKKDIDSTYDSNLDITSTSEQNVIHNSLPTEVELSHVRPTFNRGFGMQAVETDRRIPKNFFMRCVGIFSSRNYNSITISNFILTAISIVVLIIVVTSVLATQTRHKSDGLLWSSVNYLGGITEFINI